MGQSEFTKDSGENVDEASRSGISYKYEEKIEKKGDSELHREVVKLEKQEITRKIANLIGKDDLDKAAKLLHELKYDITDYVLKAEFNIEHSLSTEVALWIEQKRDPAAFKSLHDIVKTYLKA